jgi:hypothetical protein
MRKTSVLFTNFVTADRDKICRLDLNFPTGKELETLGRFVEDREIGEPAASLCRSS